MEYFLFYWKVEIITFAYIILYITTGMSGWRKKGFCGAPRPISAVDLGIYTWTINYIIANHIYKCKYKSTNTSTNSDTNVQTNSKCLMTN